MIKEFLSFLWAFFLTLPSRYKKVHDLLESAAVDPYHRSNSSVMLDWRGVDAHLRTLREVKEFKSTLSLLYLESG